MDNLDKYAEQQRRQNLGYTCEYCDSAAGHRVSCFLLSGTLTVTGQDFVEDKYRITAQDWALNPVDTIEEAITAVNKYYRQGLTKEPTQADVDSLLGPCGISWEGDKR